MANKRVCETKTGERDWRNSTRAASSSSPPPPLDSPLCASPSHRPAPSLSIRQTLGTVVSLRAPGKRDTRPSAHRWGWAMLCSTQSGLHSFPSSPRQNEPPSRCTIPSQVHEHVAARVPRRKQKERDSAPHCLTSPHCNHMSGKVRLRSRSVAREPHFCLATYVRTGSRDVNSCVLKGAGTVRTWRSTDDVNFMMRRF